MLSTINHCLNSTIIVHIVQTHIVARLQEYIISTQGVINGFLGNPKLTVPLDLQMVLVRVNLDHYKDMKTKFRTLQRMSLTTGS